MRTIPSVLVLTKDEEINIAECLESLAFSDDIVVLDSFSSDRTVEIATRFPNVRVIQRKFDTWSRHSNWALENIQWKNPWVYYSDADERLPASMREEILAVINDAQSPHVAFEVCYRNIFRGRWLKHGGLFPVWIIRLFRPECICYEDRDVNPRPVVRGSLGRLIEPFDHFSFNKGLAHWFRKHDSYSTMEAIEAARVRQQTRAWMQFKAMTSRDRAVRRRGLKNLSFFMPCRGALRFIYGYFLKRGLLDGAAGASYALMISIYEYWIEIKRREREGRWTDLDRALVERICAQSQSQGSSGHRVAVVLLLEQPDVDVSEEIAAAARLGDVLCVTEAAASPEIRSKVENAGGKFLGDGGAADWLDSDKLSNDLSSLGRWDWMLRIRSGERYGVQFEEELRQCLAAMQRPTTRYRVRIRRVFMGRVLHAGSQIRVHSIKHSVQGSRHLTRMLSHPLYSMQREGVSGEIRKAIGYAESLLKRGSDVAVPRFLTILWRSLVVSGGFLGGLPGLRFAILEAVNGFVIRSIIRGG